MRLITILTASLVTSISAFSITFDGPGTYVPPPKSVIVRTLPCPCRFPSPCPLLPSPSHISHSSPPLPLSTTLRLPSLPSPPLPLSPLSTSPFPLPPPPYTTQLSAVRAAASSQINSPALSSAIHQLPASLISGHNIPSDIAAAADGIIYSHDLSHLPTWLSAAPTNGVGYSFFFKRLFGWMRGGVAVWGWYGGVVLFGFTKEH